jgi:hypothetical protein
MTIKAHAKLRQEDNEFKASLEYIVRPCLKKKAGRYLLNLFL